MTTETLGLLAKAMKTLGLNYAFVEWKGEPVYPYWVGEYQETPQATEDGLQETDFILTGFTRSTWLELEAEKTKIEKHFSRYGSAAITNTGNAVVFCYENSLVVPTGDAELKRIEIHISVKEWKVN